MSFREDVLNHTQHYISVTKGYTKLTNLQESFHDWIRHQRCVDIKGDYFEELK